MTSTIRKSIVALLLLFPCPILADVSLPAIFSDNMVLQRQIAISVWGNADANEEITIALDTQRVMITADAGVHGRFTWIPWKREARISSRCAAKMSSRLTM